MKAILMSIQPKWCEKIFNGTKIIEVRKTAPKLETPFKVYVCCTNGRFDITDIDDLTSKSVRVVSEGRGKVIGEFVCDTFITDKTCGKDALFNGAACLTQEEAEKYSCGKVLYGWHITEPKLYDKPKELSEFRTPETRFHEVKQVNGYLVFGDGYRGGKVITRPPQSWQYVEEVEE